MSYSFHNLGRLGADDLSQTQREMMNAGHVAYFAASFPREISDSRDFVGFATQFQSMNTGGTTWGKGLNGPLADQESALLMVPNANDRRMIQRHEVNPRPFLAVPYMGRGTVDPSIESWLKQGQRFREKKDLIDPVEVKPPSSYALCAHDDFNCHRMGNDLEMVDVAINGWERGGQNTRHFEKKTS